LIIDTHAHYVPTTLVDAVEAGGPGVLGTTVIDDGNGEKRFRLGDRPPTRPLPAKLLDLEYRLSWMDDAGVDMQVIAPWVDLFGYHLPTDEGIAWNHMLNDTLRESVARLGRFACLASVPLQDPEAAAGVLSEAMDVGFVGAMIGTLAGDAELDAPQLEPFWTAASEREAVVFLHPAFSAGDSRLGDFGLVNAVGRVQDTTVTAARLLYSGVPERFPGARIVLSHGGGALPYVLGRLARNHALAPGSMADPEKGFAQLYFDSVVFDPEALRLLMAKAGPGRIVLGSDYPFPIGDLSPRRVVEEAGLGEEEVDGILGSNAREAFSLR
jgi:aminocarboxymuconate-semialdehyde decarboxylase